MTTPQQPENGNDTACANRDHEWEYSEQSEPHKGREYFACRKCGTVAITNGDEVEFV